MLRALLAVVISSFLVASAVAQEKNEAKPILRLEACGPTSNVTSLAFSPDGKTLYAAGFDKVVRVWNWNDAKKTFVLDEATSFRVPIGPGIDGAINAMALSDDGVWLAVGGIGVISDAMKFTEAGRVIPAKGGLTAAGRFDRGQIYVFNTRDRSVKVLRGHSGGVLSLAFAHGSTNAPKLLSAAEGWVFDEARVNTEAKVWDVLTEKEVGTREMPLVPFSRRPGLALLAPGANGAVNAGTKLDAFLAWEDGKLYRWDVPVNKVIELPAPRYDFVLDRNAKGTALVVTGIEGTRAVFAEVSAVTGAVEGKFVLPGVADKGVAEMPLAARFVGSGQEIAAIVRTFQGEAPRDDRLMILSQARANGPAPKSIALGTASPILPTIAASNEHIAVGGFSDHRILLFRRADVVAGSAAPVVLRSSGATMRSVAFVKKGDERGLAVGETLGGKAEAVFDLSNGKLLPTPAGWADDSAPAAVYQIGINLLEVSLNKAGQAVSKIKVREGIVTATAVMPAMVVDFPLVAVASFVPAKGATALEIFNGATGEMLRRCVGHVAPIRSLSFRADGKLLASAADDQTTAVWSFTDLGEIIGKHGSAGDLAVELRGKDLIVIDAAGVNGLANNDLVRGVFDKTGKIVPLAKAGEFYEAVWMKKPGSAIKIQVEQGGAAKDVDVAVRQGVDVRKPLFTLFFPRNAAGKLGDWLGWNAIGPYDASRKDVEQYLGWHFNTGKAESPTSFAFIDQYRKEYFRPGLLKAMAELGDLPPPPKPPAPKPVLLVPGVVEGDVLLTRVGGEYLLRKNAFDLHVTVPGYEPIPGDRMTWQLDGGPMQAFDPADGNLFSAKVDVPAGADAMRKVIVHLTRTPDGWPAQEYRADVPLRLVAPPPKIELEIPKTTDAIKTDKEDFRIKAKIRPGAAGVAFVGKLVHDAGKDVKSEPIEATAKEVEIATTMKLVPGLNVILFRAVNERAFGRDNEEEESASVTLKVTFVERKVPPPQIVLKSITPTGGTAIPASADGVRVDASKVTIQGEVTSEEPIVSAEWSLGDKVTELPSKTGAFQFEVVLKPGPQRVRLAVKTAKGGEASAAQPIVYRPQLPKLVLASPESGFTITGDAALGDVAIEVRWQTAEEYPLHIEAIVRHDGQKIGGDVANTIASAGQVRFDKLPLAPGSNEIEVRSKHPFGGDDEVQTVRGRYVRPPKIVSLMTAPVGKTPFVDLSAEALSWIAPKSEHVVVTVNGRPVRPGAVSVQSKDGKNWTIDAKQVPLPATKGKETKSDIALSFTTGDGTVRMALKEPVAFSLPFAPPPEIVLMEPALREATLSDPVAKIRFKATSEAPLTRAEIVRGDKVLKVWQAPPAGRDGVYEFALDDLPLEWGLNPISISATNEGGVKTVGVTLNVPPAPVRLEIDHVEIAPAGIKIPPEVDGGFSPVPTGRVVLHGSVKWNSNDDAALTKAKQVRLFVNGFQQLPVELKPSPGKPRERKFQVPVVLNFADNLVEIDLPELKQDAANRRKIPLGCRQPTRGQHLHVLVIAPSEREESKLVDAIARGLKAQSLGKNEYKTPVFDQVRFYVLAKHVQLLEISSRLDRIAESLKERARGGNPNDLVMIYFQGKETVGDTGPVLWTSETAPWLQLTLNDLSKNYLSRFSGGQVLILDTISQAGDIDTKGLRFAYMRRPDPRPLSEADRVRFAAELEKEMPRVVWLDQLATILAAQVRPVFQSYLPEEMRNKIQLNPN